MLKPSCIVFDLSLPKHISSLKGVNVSTIFQAKWAWPCLDMPGASEFTLLLSQTLHAPYTIPPPHRGQPLVLWEPPFRSPISQIHQVCTSKFVRTFKGIMQPLTLATKSPTLNWWSPMTLWRWGKNVFTFPMKCTAYTVSHVQEHAHTCTDAKAHHFLPFSVVIATFEYGFIRNKTGTITLLDCDGWDQFWGWQKSY